MVQAQYAVGGQEKYQGFTSERWHMQEIKEY